MTTAASRILLLVGLLFGFFSTGCVFSDDQRILRVWADYNTLKTPALFIQETDHLPYHASRIKHYRWMYNAGHGQQNVGIMVYPTAIVAPAEQAGQRIDKPVPLPEEPRHTPQTVPSSERPPLPSNKPPGLGSVGGEPAPRKPPSKPIPLKRTVPDGPSAVRKGLIRPANL